MKKILVTGNAGYIGSHLTKALSRDYEVWGLDKSDAIAPVMVHYKHDITTTIKTNFPKFDAIVHLAGLVSVAESFTNKDEYMLVNVSGTNRIVERLSYDNLILASTGCTTVSQSPYSISKLGAEHIVKLRCKSDYTIFRFFNVIGSAGYKPTNPDGLMSQLQKAAETGSFTIYGTDYNTRDGTPLRDYVHVQEICAAIILAIETPSNSIENLGHGQGYTVREMVNQFKLSNSVEFEVLEGTRREGDFESLVLDSPSRYMKKLYSMNELLIV